MPESPDCTSNLWQHPRLSISPTQQTVGLLVVEELVGLWIKVQLLVRPQGNVAQVDQLRRHVSDFDVASRRTAIADGFDEITFVADIVVGFGTRTAGDQLTLRSMRPPRAVADNHVAVLAVDSCAFREAFNPGPRPQAYLIIQGRARMVPVDEQCVGPLLRVIEEILARWWKRLWASRAVSFLVSRNPPSARVGRSRHGGHRRYPSCRNRS